MKTLKTKKVNVAVCWNSLRLMPPKEFPTMAELEATTAILDKLQEGIPDFVKSSKELEKMNDEIILGKINDKEVEDVRKNYFKESSKLELETGDEIVEVEFENGEFNTFFQQFERWGKLWFPRLEGFLNFRKDMNVTNAQPKDKPKETPK